MALVAIRPIREHSAAAKAEAHQLTVDRRPGRLAGRNEQGARHSAGQIAARVRARDVDLHWESVSVNAQVARSTRAGSHPLNSSMESRGGNALIPDPRTPL